MTPTQLSHLRAVEASLLVLPPTPSRLLIQSLISTLVAMREDTHCWEFVGQPLMGDVLRAFPLETLTQTKIN